MIVKLIKYFFIALYTFVGITLLIMMIGLSYGVSKEILEKLGII